MQPKVVCLCLLAMLLFTSTGCALPVNTRQKPDKSAAQRKLKPHANGKLPTTPALPPSTKLRKPRSPYKASFLNSEGRLRPDTKKAEKKQYRPAARSARERVDRALKAIDGINRNAALHNLLSVGVDWERSYVPVGITKEEPVIYVAIEGERCDPYCFAFTARPTTGGHAYGELLYPMHSSDEFEFGILAFNGGRNFVRADPTVKEEIDTFLNSVRDYKDKVNTAKANPLLVWPILMMASTQAPSLAH
ncbi:hypothetical protein BDP27DRAFT_1366923 [Rhodocollybia butyracea]|uniref:Lipoprotein n=1 Tax=Rhodocollybia butyracea TaxID=206335 RepID=A0A9P5U4J3_9AGAR|nr:hypothetical protein BDP27DRAFT_1366923 [Rhodocollybia butyracea]